MHVAEWLGSLPVELIYLIVGVVILTESMGVPLPGEITLVSASLLAATGVTSVWGVAISASVGAIVGDSLGYAIGRRGGRNLLERFGRRFPRHFGPSHLARAEQTFKKYGVWAVFFGRFVALLRILAGPLAGALHVPYRKFLVANATGGIVWAFGTSFAIYYAGQAAEKYLSGFSWIALAAAVLFGIATTLYLRRRANRADELLNDDDPTTNPTAADEIAAVAVDAARDGLASARPPRPARTPTASPTPTARTRPTNRSRPHPRKRPRRR